MCFFCLRENSEFGSYPGSNVPVLCPSDYCGSSSKKVLKYFTVFMKNVIKKKHSIYNKKPLFILRPLINVHVSVLYKEPEIYTRFSYHPNK